MDYYDYEHGLNFLGDVVAAVADIYNPTGNVGYRYENDTFLIRSFCWGCDVCDNGPDRCEPNFLYKPTGFSIHWYKYMGRGMEIKKHIAMKDWIKIVINCLDSLDLGSIYEK